jgi:hypothetical protein
MMTTSNLSTDLIDHVVITHGRGPQGPPGESGTSSITVEAGENLSIHDVVYIADGLAYRATPADAERVIGVATQSASTGGHVDVRSSGLLEEATWAWFPGFLYLSDSGRLTQTAPTAGNLLIVGFVLSPTKIFIRIEPPLELN